MRNHDDLLGPPPAEQEAPRHAVLPSRSRGADLALVGGAHEGASRFSREMALWQPPLRSADADTLSDRPMANARARDTMRNDAYVQSGMDIHKDSIVGSMFLLNAKPNTRALGIDDEEWEKEFQAEVEAKFTLWAESPDCWVDATGRNTLTGLVRLAIGVYLMSGEVLATAEYIRDRDRSRLYNTAIQMIEVDRLCSPYGGTATSVSKIRDGVELNEYGKAVAYHIRGAHPSDVTMLRPEEAYTWKRVLAKLSWGRQQVLHVMEQQRIDQTRGISQLVSALKEMRTTKRFRDIVLQNAVVNATFAASIESDLPKLDAFETIGGGDSSALVDYAENYLQSCADYGANSNNLAIDGVRIPHLFPGTKLQLRPAGSGGALGENFEASLLRYVAANLGVSYEQLSRDYSQSNYSNIRAALTETWKFMLSRKKMVADRFATAIYRLWFEEAVNKGQIESIKGKVDFYALGMKDAYTECDWIGASRGQIDELKETQAAALRIQKGLSTYEEELARLGKDWRKVFAQQQREMEERKERGLLMPADDPEMMNALETEKAKGGGNNGSGNEDDEDTDSKSSKDKKK